MQVDGQLGGQHEEGVTISAGVPTVWIGVQEYLDKHPDVDVSWALTQHIDVYRDINDRVAFSTRLKRGTEMS